jgi:uncharacterized membrane protein YdjX (TVP38/TMEM64 family)
MSAPHRVPRRLWIVLGVGVCCIAVAALLRDAAGIEWSAASVRARVEDFGVWAPLVLIALLALRFALLIPSQVLLAAGGLLFGALAGALYGAVGLTLAAVIKYGLVQWTGVDALRAQLPARFAGMIALSRSRTGVGALAVVSAYPVGPIGFVHLAAARPACRSRPSRRRSGRDRSCAREPSRSSAAR